RYRRSPGRATQLRSPADPPSLWLRRRPPSEIQAHHLWLVIRGLVRELRVDMDDIVLELEVRKEVVAEEDVVKHLRVPVEDVCVALALLKGLNQRMELEITRALQGGQRVRELKVVDVCKDDHVRAGIECGDLASRSTTRVPHGIAIRLGSVAQ